MTAPLEHSEFVHLRDFVHTHLGIQLSEGKMSMVEQRLRPLVEARGHSSFREFIDVSLKQPSQALMTDLVNRITTNHTYFNRESEHFDFLMSKVLPELIPKIRSRTPSGSTPTFRMWCAAASRGHEPFTLAMLQRKHLGRDYSAWDAGLLATDISENALSVAVRGVYPGDEVEAMPKELRENYMRKMPDGNWEVLPEVRRDVTYRKFNLHSPVYKFKRAFDVIFCRNVLIYFDGPTKASVVDKLSQVLMPGGYLFVGLAESLGRQTGSINYLRPGIYQKAHV